MFTSRREFCASLTALGFASRVSGQKPVPTLTAASVLSLPHAIYAYFEDGTVELTKAGTDWTADGITVTTAPASARTLPITISAPAKRLLRVRLHWAGSLPRDWEYLGDAWERSYGDLSWHPLEPERVLPWYFLAGNGRAFLACGVETNPAAFCFWQVDPSGIALWLDVRNGGGGVELGKRTLTAAIIVAQEYREQSAYAAACEFCRKMARNAVFMASPLYGGNNWYYAYGNSSADDIRADTERIADYAPSVSNRPFMVIDDGWSPYATTGPWTSGNSKFPDMARLASDMLHINVRPGLWFRPLTTHDAVPDNLLLKSEFASRLFARERMRTLDPTTDGAAEQIRSDVRRLCSWGFQILKHDFSTFDLLGRWGFQMSTQLTDGGWHFADRTRTNAEIIRSFYAMLREAAGTTSLLGCNTVGHLATGLFEVQRIGDDTSGREWSRTRKMGINTLAFRAPQQGAFFDIDADCVGLTKAIPWSLNRQWLDLLARSGSPLFVSAAPDAVGPEQRQALREAFRIAAARQPVCEPLDWMQTNEPQQWRFGKTKAQFDWYADDHSLPL